MPDYRQSRTVGPPGRGMQQEVALPQAATVHYFVNQNLNIRLVDEDAEKWARDFSRIPTSQLRRFYEHVLGLRRRLDVESEQGAAREQTFERLRAEFKMLRAKAAYTFGRAESQKKDSYRSLLQFFTDHTAAVKTVKDFEAFCQHFQAVVAFHKVFVVVKE